MLKERKHSKTIHLFVSAHPDIDEKGKVCDDRLKVISNGTHYSVLPIIIQDVKDGLDYKNYNK